LFRHPAEHLDPDASAAVDQAIIRMGIRQDMLNGARRTKWRNCVRTIDKYTRVARKPRDRTQEESEMMEELAEELITMAMAQSPFSATARCCLIRNRLSNFIIRNELEPLQLT
jgi:hypothetical protein